MTTLNGQKIKNVLFFFTDQQRMDQVGCYGNARLRTPCMDALAARGLRFTHAMSPSPVCTPARGSLQTGLLPHHHGQIFNPEFKQNGGEPFISDDRPFFARILKEHGYRCAHVGKWHVGSDLDPNPNHPSSLGYDDDLPYFWGYGFPMQNAHYLEYLRNLGVDGWKTTPTILSNGRPFALIQEGPKEAAIPFYLADLAKKKLDQIAENEAPFFLSVNFWGPHAPYHLPESVYRSYEDTPFEPCPSFFQPLDGKPYILDQLSRCWGMDQMAPETLSTLMALDAAYTTAIDGACAQVVERLEQLGKLEETLIVFTSDHGSYNGSHRGWDKGIGMYDCLIRIPMILSHPSISPAVSDALVGLVDLTATFLDVAGVSAADYGMDGQSLLPLIDPSPGRPAFREADELIAAHPGHMATWQQRMVRSRQYKYIFNFGAPEEFYDLEQDPLELTNQATNPAYAAELKRMRNRLREWVLANDDLVAKRLFMHISP